MDLAFAIKGEQFILDDPLWAEVYAPNGTALVEGDICYRKRYADTLEKISWYGPDWFCESLLIEVCPRGLQPHRAC